jgi:hypothetical protein
MLGHGDAVDHVVAGHHQVQFGLAHARLERDQVQLAQHVLGDPRVVCPALGLGVVAHEVLGRGGYSGPAQPGHVGHGHPGDEHRVLAERLEAAPAERCPHDVDGGREQHVDALAPGLRAERERQLADQARVPGGTESRWAGQARRRMALVHGPAADPGRAVGHDHRAQPDDRQRMGAPVVGAGQQPHLVLQAEFGQQVTAAARRAAVAGVWRRAGLRPAAGAAGRPVGVVHLGWYSSQDAGVRCKSVYSMYGAFGTGSMYWLLAVGQPV